MMDACARRHNFTSYAMKLNEITPGLQDKLAPTDCRLRPDQKATENGEYDLVSHLSVTVMLTTSKYEMLLDKSLSST